jgi:hypothetical protein
MARPAENIRDCEAWRSRSAQENSRRSRVLAPSSSMYWSAAAATHLQVLARVDLLAIPTLSTLCCCTSSPGRSGLSTLLVGLGDPALRASHCADRACQRASLRQVRCTTEPTRWLAAQCRCVRVRCESRPEPLADRSFRVEGAAPVHGCWSGLRGADVQHSRDAVLVRRHPADDAIVLARSRLGFLLGLGVSHGLMQALDLVSLLWQQGLMVTHNP